jgi:xanthine dehydrogenase small subunit
MSLFALYQNKGDHNKQQLNKEPVSRQDVITALSGNLCRCTGYRPIIDAALDACNQEVADQFSAAEQETIAQLKALASEQNIGTESLIMPHSREQLAQAVNQYPEARLVAGSTDLALESTQQLKPLPVLIDLSQVDILRRVEQQPDKLTIGAACPLADIHGVLIQHFPQLDEVIERFASLPIRNQAILGVNVANASPIGDMPPVLLALNATINLDDGSRLRHLPIKDFFTGYRQTQLAKGEWIDSIDIPLPEQHSQHLRAYKISKRIEDDISAVCAVFNLVLDEDRVISLSSGFGGVAATPASSPALAHAVVGMQWDSHECIEIGKTILSRAFQPIDDARASANYRREVLAKLWQRFWLETSGQSIPTRTLAYA